MFKSWTYQIFFSVKRFMNCPYSLRSVYCLLVYTKTVDGVEGVLRWATQTVNIFQYSPRYLRPKILLLQELTSWSHLFVLYYLPVLVYTNTTIHPSVRGYWWIFTHNTPPPLWWIVVNITKHPCDGHFIFYSVLFAKVNPCKISARYILIPKLVHGDTIHIWISITILGGCSWRCCSQYWAWRGDEFLELLNNPFRLL